MSGNVNNMSLKEIELANGSSEILKDEIKKDENNEIHKSDSFELINPPAEHSPRQLQMSTQKLQTFDEIDENKIHENSNIT